MSAITRNDPDGVTHAAATWLKPRRDELLGFVRALIEHESPSGDVDALARVATWMRSHVPAGYREETLVDEAHGAHLIWRTGPTSGRGPLILTHYDTVWPRGTTHERPVAIDGDRLSGPGVFDMKASIGMAIFALRAVDEACAGLTRPITLSVTPDEEVGNPSTRVTIERLAREASSVLVLEPPLPGGALKTRRKGIAQVHIDVEGIAAHAGLDLDDGANAALEVAHLVLAAAELADATHGTTVNVGIVRAGDRRNVVPASGEIVLDVRSWDEAEITRVIASLEGVTPTINGARIRVRGSMHRPPMERTSAVSPILCRARAAGAALGITLDEGEAGGGSEANLTAALSPTLDGLGPEGGGAHAVSEHVFISSLYERTALLAGIIAGES